MNDPIEFHPRLVEGAVWAAVRGGPEEPAFHQEREPAYLMGDPEARDRAFGRIHAAWFRRLALDRPVREALDEQGMTLASLHRCLAGVALREKDQGAELFVSESGERTLVLSMRPETLVDVPRALTLLRRELMHVADILDPRFRFEPRLPDQAAGPAQDRLLQDRYRVLWNCSVDGRLAAVGRLDAAARELRLGEFARAFSCLGDAASSCFDRLFGDGRPDHPSLVAMAQNPVAAFDVASGSLAAGRCALCGFPTTVFEPGLATLSASVRERIRSDFPAWEEGRAICPQCADLYRARSLSLAAAAEIPGETRLPPG